MPRFYSPRISYSVDQLRYEMKHMKRSDGREVLKEKIGPQSPAKKSGLQARSKVEVEPLKGLS